MSEIKICEICKKDIDIEKHSYFESISYNYRCYECGDKVLTFKETWEFQGYNYIDPNEFEEYDESCNYGYEEYWKLEEKEK